uniref:SAP domain-containing ribonucleoprotein n=1 Tax=Tetraodon nigroviridis TaxID=99883 RepID=H3D4G5_TETNG
MAEVVELHKLKLAELRQECDARGLETKGNKGELIARLQAYLEEHAEEDVDVDDVLVEDAEDFAKAESDNIINDIKDPESPVQTVAEKKVVKINPSSTASERLQKRAERFSLPASAESKKALRAASLNNKTINPSSVWSTGAAANSKAAVNIEQLKKRAERFGMNVSTISQKIEEDEKLKKRKERFGALTNAGSAGAADTEECYRQRNGRRAERFGIV